jgi:hypothetical protein
VVRLTVLQVQRVNEPACAAPPLAQPHRLCYNTANGATGEVWATLGEKRLQRPSVTARTNATCFMQPPQPARSLAGHCCFERPVLDHVVDEPPVARVLSAHVEVTVQRLACGVQQQAEEKDT